MRAENSVWQVPETCAWNRYVEDGAEAIAELGWTILRPAVCEDGPASTAIRTWHGPAPAVVHLHWPEKLAKSLGADQAIALIKHLKQQGARVVQTVHNVSPHEAGATKPWFQHTIDTLTDGVHFFSTEHEVIARANRPALPAKSVILPHPRYVSVPPARIGCFGRIRDYKRTADFAEALLADPDLAVQLVVVGHADSQDAAKRLRTLADTDARLDFQPEFVAAHKFEATLASVDWVALPYRTLHSSGVLVSALQAGRRVLSPRPVGGTDLYGTYCPHHWIVIDPWTDQTAVQALTRAIGCDRSNLSLPSWSTAANTLTSFYTALTARPPRPLPEEK